MTIKRKAILIASPFAKIEIPPPEPVWGVKNDIIAWENFLIDPMGGSWNSETEIINGSNYTVQDLENAISSLDGMQDYIFFVYSGHGFAQSRNESFIILGHGTEYIPIETVRDWLYKKTERGTMIIDACRQGKPSSIQSGVSFQIKKNERLDESYLQPSRTLWEDEFEQSKTTTGIVTIQSCGFGQKSYMLGNNQFSVFSWFLNRGFRSSKQWLTVGDAFSIADAWTKKETQSWITPVKQDPECDNPLAAYPFCLEHTVSLASQYFDI